MASDGTIKISTELDGAQLQKAMSKMGSIAKTGLKSVATAAVATGISISGIGVYAVKTGIEFESAFAGVKKTVNATDEELQGFRDGIREMAKEIPQTAAEIASVAEAAGQLGIKNKNLLDFTEVMSNLGVATNMSATEAATALARLANITQMPQENFGRLGSTIVALGNNLATTESEITEMGLRLAGAGKQVGMSEAQILGLAGALSSVGIEADAGGSSVSTVMAKMQLAVEKGGESLAQFADVAGMSSEQFQQAFRENAAQALVTFITGLSTMEARGKSAIATLDDMEITEIRQRDALLRLSGAGDVLSQSLSIATQAWEENNALTNEAEQRYQTLESRLQVLKNNIADFGIEIYDSFRDPLKNTVDESIGYVEQLHSAFSTGGLKAVVRELGDVFDDVTDKVASTSDAAEGIVTPIKNLTSAGASLVKSVLPVAADGLELMAENMDKLIPLVTTGVTAFKGYKTVGNTLNTVSKVWKVTSGAIDVFNAAQLVAMESGTKNNAVLKLSQAVVGVLTGKIQLASAAQGVWNTVLNANPIGIVVTAVAALAAGIGAYKLITDDAAESTGKLTKEQEETLESCNKLTQEMKNQHAAREENVLAIDREYSGYESLLGELQSITDANGNVKAGYEDRASVITGLLSQALGIEIQMLDGQIQKYGEVVTAIDEVITKKKAEAILSSMQDDMADAYKRTNEAITEYKNAAKDAAEITEELELAQKEADIAQERWENSAGMSAEAIEEFSKQSAEADEKVRNLTESQEKATKEANALKAEMEGLSAELDSYQLLDSAVASGDVAKMEEALNALITSYRSYSSEALAESENTRQALYDQANGYVESLELIQDGTLKLSDEMYKQFADSAIKTINNFNQLPGGIAEGIEGIGAEASAAMISALAVANLSGKLDEEAQKDLQSFIDGFSGLEEETQEIFAQAWFGALSGLEGFEELADPAEEGVDAFITSLEEALEVHSPSRAVARIFEQVWPGASQGLDNGQEELGEKGRSVIQNFLAILGGEDFAANAQSIGSKIMSFFGFGVSSQVGNSVVAGTANANAANAGAGSVDPTPTGNTFGSKYAGGVSSQAEAANASGVSLSDNAYSGAGSKDGYTPGSDFGSGFVKGIGAWLQDAAEAAANLAISAYEALKAALWERSPSRKTKRSGKNFDLGLAIGVEDNAKYAVAAAEQLGEDTINALDTDAIYEKMKGLDISSMMNDAYFAVDDWNTRVSGKVVAEVERREQERYGRERQNEKKYDDFIRTTEKLLRVANRPIEANLVLDKRKAANVLVYPIKEEMSKDENLKKMIGGEK